MWLVVFHKRFGPSYLSIVRSANGEVLDCYQTCRYLATRFKTKEEAEAATCWGQEFGGGIEISIEEEVGE